MQKGKGYNMQIRGISEAVLNYDPQFIPKSRASVVICPGGGYEFLSPREAEPIAKAFQSQGFLPLILEYDVTSPILSVTPMRQAAWAVREARRVNEGKPVFLCGFSAGGHLAASVGVHWDDGNVFGDFLPGMEHCPDGLILCYPVITAGEAAHVGSIRRLAGEDDPSYYSLENYVSEHTPPTFLWHTAADDEVPVENSLLFAMSLSNKTVPYQLMIYPHGVHGLSLATKEVEQPEKRRLADAYVASWFEACIRWLEYEFFEKNFK